MIASIIGAAVGVGSSIAGGISSAKKAKEGRELLESQQDSLDYWYKKEMSEDYLDSDSAKSAISLLDSSNEQMQDPQAIKIIYRQ